MEKILSVFELSTAIKKQLEMGFATVHVKGEISNLKEQTSGHLYFTLKDAHAQIAAVLFKGNRAGLKDPIKNGDQIIVHGEMNVYPPRGYYQIIVRKLEHLGIGDLLLQLHALKAKLENLNWFDATRKKKLPKYPRTIGVVTSATGSVIQDILHILSRRFRGFHLILNPVKVQGSGAAEEIAAAISDFNKYKLADVLIVGRGGGSLEDLWAFNEEKVAEAIFLSEIPIISAVGHETDVCIADFVADLRAPTPSAAAEIATQETAKELQFLAQTKQRLKMVLCGVAQQYRKDLNNFKRHPLLAAPFSLLESHLQRVDDLRSSFDFVLKKSIQEKQLQLLVLKKQAQTLEPSARIATLKERLATISCALIDKRILEQIRHKRQRLEQLCSHLKGIDPKNLLTKGYCILFKEKNDSVILSASEIKEQDRVRLQLHDGKALLTVNGLEK